MGRYKMPYTLYKRGKYWYYRIYNSEGVRGHGISTGQKTKSAAREFCERLYIRGNIYNSGVTFGAFAAHFYDDNSLYFLDRARPLSDNTIINYQKNFRLYIMPYFENIKIVDINYSLLKQFRIHIIGQGLAVNSVNTVMSILKHVIDAAYKDDVINENPFNKLESIQSVQAARDAFTIDEVIKLYNEIGEEFRGFILFMALTGLRISEAVGVTLDDIKQSASGFKYINLTKQLNRGKYSALKTHEARPVPVTDDIINLIGFEPSRLSALYRAFEPIKKEFAEYKARSLSFHSLRHFFITNSKSSGVIESKIEIIAGHKLRRMAGVYTNYKVEDLGDVIPWQEKTYNLIIKSVLTFPE